MNNNTPHRIMLLIILTCAHYTQLGAEIAEKVMPAGGGALSTISSWAVWFSMWLLLAMIVPWCCRRILALYEWAGRATDTLWCWGRARLIEAIKDLLNRLGQ
jgi:hypothetical protein